MLVCLPPLPAGLPPTPACHSSRIQTAACIKCIPGHGLNMQGWNAGNVFTRQFYVNMETKSRGKGGEKDRYIAFTLKGIHCLCYTDLQYTVHTIGIRVQVLMCTLLQVFFVIHDDNITTTVQGFRQISMQISFMHYVCTIVHTEFKPIVTTSVPQSHQLYSTIF